MAQSKSRWPRPVEVQETAMPTVSKAPQGPRWPQALFFPIIFHEPHEADPPGREGRLEASWAGCLARKHEEG